MNQLEVFNNEQFGEIRVVEINDEPWFVGKDVAEVLGYSNSRDALAKKVSEEDKGVANCDTLGGTQDVTIINESGLYSLIFSSKLPKAKEFKHWVTSEVLPTIRKHGMYAIDELIANPDMALAAFKALKEEREKNKRLEEENAVQSQQLAELQPKASYYDVVLNCKDLLAIGKIAKDFGWSAKKMNKYLHEKRVQFKQGDIWLLYQKYANKGYTSTKTQTFNGNDGMVHTSVHTYWTQKGRLFIYDLLKSEDILPLIEKG